MATTTKNESPQFSRTINRRLFCRRLPCFVTSLCFLAPTRHIDKTALTIWASHGLTIRKRIRNLKCRVTRFTVYNHRIHLSLPPTRKERNTPAAKIARASFKISLWKAPLRARCEIPRTGTQSGHTERGREMPPVCRPAQPHSSLHILKISGFQRSKKCACAHLMMAADFL